jgi:hypothetical protein
MIIELPTVTLFGLDTINHAGLLRAAEICQREIKFGAVKIITEKLFPDNNRNEGRRGYSRFMIRELNKHFDTSHVLVFQADGYIQNPSAWDNEWLQYDYAGAPWNWYHEHQVGNGGFSLRSKKLCDILSTDSLFEYKPEDEIVAGNHRLYLEDHVICKTYRLYLETTYGIKFAPLEVAKAFSIEGYAQPRDKQKYNNEFGFHGRLVYDLNIPL